MKFDMDKAATVAWIIIDAFTGVALVVTVVMFILLGIYGN